MQSHITYLHDLRFFTQSYIERSNSNCRRKINNDTSGYRKESITVLSIKTEL
jgi:hypothetical protein